MCAGRWQQPIFSALFMLGALVSVPAPARADRTPPGERFGEHHGYTQNVVEERDRRDLEMVMLPPPPPPPPSLGEKLVNDRLSREFQKQYEYRFGQTQAEQSLNSVSRSEGEFYYTGRNVTVQEYSKYQRDFGEYMSRRLVEYHVDQWFRNDPSLRPVYEFKERVSNVNVQVRKGYKLKWKYNLSGPHMDLSLENPWDIETRVRMEMTGIVSAPTEVIYSVIYPVTKRVRLTMLHRQTDGLYQAVATRQLTPSLSTSLSASTDNSPKGDSVKQDLILVGFSWSN
jgi:hypothetical protein